MNEQTTAGIHENGGCPVFQRLCDMLPSLGCIHDAVTVGSSVADVVLDVLVAIEFFSMGDEAWPFFIGCCIIFGIANMTYAFLFAATMAPRHSPVGRVCVFLCVLPFAQLVPVFVWIESFHFEAPALNPDP